MNPDNYGHAEIEPSGTFPVAFTGTWRITYTVGIYGIDDGGSVIIVRRAMSDAVMPQCSDPAANGYVAAETDGDASLRVTYDNRYWIRPWRGAIVVAVYDGSLKQGDVITVTLGDTSGGSPGWSLQTFPETKHTLKVLVDAFGTREYYEIHKQPSISIIPGEPVAIEAVVQTTAKPGDEVPVFVRILDEWGNPVDHYNGMVTLDLPEGTHGPAEPVFVKPGVEKIGSLRFAEDGTYVLGVSGDGLKGVSNPVVVRDGIPGIIWGDMHGQTEQTVGTGTVAEYFSFARDKALIDVAGWQGNDFQVTDATWADICARTKEFNDPGRFVTLLGYEWSGLTPAGGDHNILYLGDDQPIHRSSHWQIHDGSSEGSDRYPISELWNEFRGRDDVMAIAHVGGRYADFDYWDEEFPGLVEIHSHHGTFEWFAEEALRRGLIIGLVGQSDDHTGRPGLSAPLRPLARDFATFDVYGGYTGIFAEEKTREAVWNALRARHCYATTGARIFLDVRTSDDRYMMGDAIQESCPVDLTVDIAGTAPVLDAWIMKNNDIVYRYPFSLDPNDMWVRMEWSGVRIKSRSKTADWDGRISVNGGIIEDFHPYAFDRMDQGIERITEKELAVMSTTSGDTDGVFLRISGGNPVVVYDNGTIRFESAVNDLADMPKRFDAGGVNLRMTFSLCSPFMHPDKLSFSFRDDTTRDGMCAYRVKVVQIDGHMAWSSPMYFG